MRTQISTIITLIFVFTFLSLFAPIHAETLELPDGSKADLGQSCPVCGMKVTMAKIGQAAVVFKDGKVVVTDGPRDMFKFILDPKKYDFDPASIKEIYVTDYATKKIVDGKKAYYVIGSDVMGSMGKAPIPFLDQSKAEELSKSKNGQKVIPFEEVTLNDVAPKRKMLKMEHGHGGSGKKAPHDHGSGSKSK